MVVASVALLVAPRLLQPVSAGPPIAPDPSTTSEAVVQVYGADVWGVRGRFAIHTWVVTKDADATFYRRYQVIGWLLRRGQSVVSVTRGDPDTPWFGSQPVLLKDVRGQQAQSLIARIHATAMSYPYADEYVMWPGPNSNSFTAWIGLNVPELELELPAKAIGKTWMVDNF
jgi:hypothetical protein